MEHELCILSCQSGRSFAEKTVKELCNVFDKYKKIVKDDCKIILSSITTKKFNDGEIYQRLEENVRGKDIFVFQSLQSPGNISVNENLMELLLLNGILKLSSTHTITNVIPYQAYGRQDRKTKGREGISAKLIAKLIEASGADRVLTMDLHSGQIQGFYDILVDNLTALPILAKYAKNAHKGKNLVVVAPDAGGVARAQKFSELLNAGLAIINKHRPEQSQAETFGLVGDVQGKEVLIIDDMIDTAGTLQEAVNVLRKHNCGNITAYCTHPLLSNPATERLFKLGVKVVGTDTIYHNENYIKNNKWFTQLSVANIFAEAIFNIHTNRSVSKLMDELQQMN